MLSDNEINEFRNKIETFFSPYGKFDTNLFWKGRVALYAILKAIEIKKGDEIIIPAFTCIVVPNAVIYSGATPIYSDISTPSYTIDVAKIEEKITPKTKAILAQNTFGLPPDLDSLKSIAKKHSLYLIEDCAHGFGSLYKNKLCGTYGDAAFFSTQWNKTFSTGIGGIVISDNININKRLNELNDDIFFPSFKDRTILNSLYFFNDYLLNNFTYWFALKAFRLASNLNFMVGSNSSDEFENILMPDKYFKSFSDLQAKKGIVALDKLNDNLSHRKKISNKYHKIFEELNIEPTKFDSYSEHSYLKYSFFVKERNNFLQLAEKNKIEISDWFNSPIHPIQNSFHKWNYESGKNPISDKVSMYIVNLPTHKKINDNYIDKLYNFLRKNRSLIFDSVKDIVK